MADKTYGHLDRASENTGEQRIVLFESQDGKVVLSVAIDVSEQEVWLNREQLSMKSQPELDKLLKMCEIFDCTFDELVTGDLIGRAVPATASS